MNKDGFVLHGAVAYCKDKDTLITYEDAYVVCVEGICRGVFETLPKEYAGLPCEDLWDKLIIPGLIDLHVHASQFQLRGNGMDMELLEWLNHYIFPEEAKYSDLEYAERAYDLFVEDLYVGGTTRAVVFATIDPDATLGLMDMLEDTGLITYVGKVNMDRNAPDYYIETTEESLELTRNWLDAAAESEYRNTRPILTPRFTPTCSRELLKGLGAIVKEYDVPVQSHLSENLGEIESVKKLEPDTAFYAESYEKAGLLDQNRRCIMAHCVWSPDAEVELLKKYGVFIAHSPDSNTNLGSGVAPVSRYLELGLHVGLASDVSGGSTASMFAAMRAAVQASKLRWRLYDEKVLPLSFVNAFYLATKGGGAFFGKVGSFEDGYEFDAIVIDDEPLRSMREEETIAERTERLAYLADDRHVVGKYVAGRKLF